MDAAVQNSGGTAAANSGQAGNKIGEVGAINIGDIFVMILSLAFVIGIIYLIYFLMKKGMGKKIAENDIIKIVGSKIINGNKAIHVIEVGKSLYLIGSSNESINLISAITDKESCDWIQLAVAEQSHRVPKRFQDIIGNLFNTQPKKQVEVDESVDFIKKQRERLKKIKEE